jgi:hypothetical protein
MSEKSTLPAQEAFLEPNSNLFNYSQEQELLLQHYVSPTGQV